MTKAPSTCALTVRGRSYFIRRFAVEVVEGVDRGKRVESSSDALTIGGEQGVDLQLTDQAVSRHHCTVRATARGLEVRDLGSTNGTFVGKCELVRGYVASGARLGVGESVVSVEILDDELEQPLDDADRFGGMLGASPAMQRLYPVLRRIAESDGTVLLTGESGTGKEVAAEAIHRASSRAGGPFVAINCGALPIHLVESELFGHERGAFTGATARIGAFEGAAGGTVLLDEIGELPLAVQPVLLRVLENHKVRPVGAVHERRVDVRVVAATHRDLRELVNQRLFRADLYFRLNVLSVELPPLRDRREDIPMLARTFWRDFRDDEPPAELVAALARQDWPGNVRELRNAIERGAIVGILPSEERSGGSYGDEKDAVITRWEREFIADLVSRHQGNLSAASRAARMGRSYLRRLARKYGVLEAEARETDEA